MSKKLNKDELVEELDTMLFRACADCFEHEPSQVAEPMEKRMGQACEQFKQLIKAQAEPSEEWIEEKAERFMLQCPGGLLHSWASVKRYIKDFIRTLLSEALMRKPKVNKLWIQTLIDVCEDVREGEMSIENLYEMLKEAGFEVKE